MDRGAALAFNTSMTKTENGKEKVHRFNAGEVLPKLLMAKFQMIESSASSTATR